jgi:phage FluMu protein Com
MAIDKAKNIFLLLFCPKCKRINRISNPIALNPNSFTEVPTSAHCSSFRLEGDGGVNVEDNIDENWK